MTADRAVRLVLDALAPAGLFLMAVVTLVLAIDHWQFSRRGTCHTGVLWTYPLRYRNAVVQAGIGRKFAGLHLFTSLTCFLVMALVLWHFYTR